MLPDVGERMQQVPKSERPSVPKEALRLKEMCDIAITRGAAGADDEQQIEITGSADSACLICNLKDMPLEKCSVCLISAHASCLQSVLSWAIRNERWCNVAAPSTCFRSIFRCTFCKLCEETELITFE